MFVYLGMTSCSDEVEHLSCSASISFSPTVEHSWLPVTRTSEDTPHGTVIPLQTDDGEEFYLHMQYSDDIIPSPLTKDKDILVTRAVPVNSGNMYTSFGVSAYSYTDFWDGSQIPNFMYDVPIVKSGNSWAPSSDYYWPGSAYKIRFFAYAPTGNMAYRLSGQVAGTPTIVCTIPADVAEQKDLLVSSTSELDGDLNAVVNLAFQHALTAVRFVCGDDMQAGTVKSVALKNIYSNATYNMETGEWGDMRSRVSFLQELDRKTSGTANDTITAEPQTFMMIPQTLPDGAAIEIVFNDGTQDHTLKADIGNGVWPKGKTVTYKISTSSINWTYTLAVTNPDGFTYTGGTNRYSVTSYRENTKGVKEPVAWTTQYSTDDGVSWSDVKPDWLTAFTVSDNGSISAQSYNATVCAQTCMVSENHTAILQGALPKGSESQPYNLSNKEGKPEVENTANCYVVNAPGVYSFPLVYGNAIKNGKHNKSSHTSAVSGGLVLKSFINHCGVAITSPYIADNKGCIPVKAELVWQDAPSLITDIEHNKGGNGGYISFKVNQATIRQGNAVIAIKDGNNAVLWSWHIWVTDEKLDETIEVTNFQKKKYNFMPVNLGWCDGYQTDYAERSCKVRFIAGNKKEEFVIMQSSHADWSGGNSPYYQWGRKDPFLPNGGNDNSNKIWYAADGTSSTAGPEMRNLSTKSACIKNCILNPNVMQNQEEGGSYINLWSVNNNTYIANDNEVVKTIYDPCPVGFKLPAGNAFTGFTPTGKNVAVSQINGTWDSTKKGWNFYTNSTKDKTVFFPTSGFRSRYNGEVRSVGQSGYWWAAIPNDLNDGYVLGCVLLGSVNPLRRSSKAYGNEVRPVRE